MARGCVAVRLAAFGALCVVYAWASQNECSGKGTIVGNNKNVCVCLSGFAGPDCSLRRCPSGIAWAVPPTATDDAHQSGAECSAMGNCDRILGECKCRSGFGGPACDRLACPENNAGASCSGHGQCVTKRWAAEHWDGKNLIRPNVSYSLWDADAMTGCLCDDGYAGYNCSSVSCPTGDVATTIGQQNEIVHIECQADSGSFAITFRGHTTVQIPHDTAYGHLEAYLEALPSIRAVTVTFASNASAAVCAPDFKARSDIEFTQEFGSLPALRLASEDLSLNGGPAHLQMVTRQSLICPSDCSNGCTGGFYLGYDGEFTQKLAWNASGLLVQQSLEHLATVSAVASDFGALNVSVNGSQVCSSDDSNMTIELRSNYGNVYNLTLLNSLMSNQNHALVNLTLIADKGTKEDAICGDRGECDQFTGVCFCNMLNLNAFQYAFTSSDGYGHPGVRGDCGAQLKDPKSCPASYDAVEGKLLECSNRGVCDNATFTCQCNEGHYSANCALRKCPTSIAWFSEATGPDEAREVQECSGMGDCEVTEGVCKCRDGFGGSACERLECSTEDDFGSVCSGNGVCLAMYRLAEIADYGGAAAGITYGSGTQNLETVWDSRKLFGCHCDTADPFQPNNGPVSFISGTPVLNPMAGGYVGFDCSKRWCPVGADPYGGGEFEEQTIAFAGSSFKVEFRRAFSATINLPVNASDVEFILENMTTISDVDVVVSGEAYDGKIRVKFLGELGDLPFMSTDKGYNVTENVRGSKEPVECSGRGVCDYTTGQCMCLKGFLGGDGGGGVGSRRDCSRRDPLGAETLNEFSLDKLRVAEVALFRKPGK
mmetsp:Transcript_18301/g.65113  ORF Transcript_18301/g.65113 Transcript_18301/m.65113 type:complete len:827 (-) Transcript_18301:915-3395(-)